MKLVHTAKMERVLPIVKNGIKRGIDLPKNQRQYVQSNPYYIYLSAVEGVSFQEIKANSFNYAAGFSKDYHFFLNIDWVKNNSRQFKERAIYSESSREFYKFMKELGIESQDGSWEDDTWGNQVISTEPIPIEGVDALLIRNWNLNHKTCDYWTLEKDLRKIDPKVIFSLNQYDKAVRLRDLLPQSMALYVGNDNQTIRIK